MKIFLKIILVILVFLAVSSGVTKIMLMKQDVEFFSSYGFTNPVLIAFGAAQLIGGILLVLKKTRIAGAVIVAITFLISGVVLIMAKNWLFTTFTLVALLLLVIVVWQSFKRRI